MLGRLLAEQSRSITVPWEMSNGGWGPWPGDSTQSFGKHVGAAESLHLLTVYGCVRFIADQVSHLPVDVYTKTGEVQKPIPTPVWIAQPTPDLEFADWCGQILASLLLHGNAFFTVNRSPDTGSIVELRPLAPELVRVHRPTGGRKRYLIGGQERPGVELVHLKALMLPGSDVGMNPIEYARHTIGLGLSALKFGAEFFDAEGNMPGVIEIPKTATPERMKDTARQWRQRRKSGGRGLPGVLDDGATWKATGVNNEQAQFLATRQWTSAEIAGQLFFVDPADLGIPVDGTSLTYANLEQRNSHRVQVTFLPWITRIEAAVSALLARPRYMKLNVNGLLRGDMKTRFESYAIGIDKKFLVPNEPRGWEDLQPLDGGDEVVATPQPAAPSPQFAATNGGAP